ncbi:MAG: hypothetical protein K0S33_1245 [Bacteroidetes bacterium]|jgi:hypothetical protein|nr:hypothetical protein [Bacteroidota bacterium]
MNLEVINTEKEYLSCLGKINDLFDRKVKPNSPEGKKLKTILLRVKQ